MAASKSVPRLLQQQPHRESDDDAWREQQQTGSREFQAKPPGDWSQPHATRAAPGRAATKGDLRTQVEAPKPSTEREVGDLEQSERETHGRARGPQQSER